MKKTNTRMKWAIGLFAALLTLNMGYSTWALRQAALMQPAVVATVDLEKVFLGLTARATGDARIQSLGEDYKAQSDAKLQEIELARQDLEIFQEGTDEYNDAMRTVARQSIGRSAFNEWATRRLDEERSLMLAELYDQIKLALVGMQTELGYDIVIVDDSVVKLPMGLDETEMMRQISARRILFSNPGIDITNDVIARMNQP